MGILYSQLQEIKRILATKRDQHVCSLGYPSIHTTKEQLDDIVNSQRIKTTNTFKKPRPDPYSLIQALGHKLDVTDFRKNSRTELHLDLNKPLDKSFVGKYDLIIDPGTIEHVFDIRQAMFNIKNMTAMNGYVFHCVPLNMPNHGFYNFSPLFFEKFYTQNGFTVDTMKGMYLIAGDEMPVFQPIPEYDRAKRFVTKPDLRSINFVIFQKTTNKPDKLPTQFA